MYIPNDWWMICDRCGSEYRYSEMRQEWTGLQVCTRGCWEARNAQDFVTGVEDDQTVPVVRTDVDQVMGETTLQFALVSGTTVAYLASISGLSDGDSIGILMDNGSVFQTFIIGTPSEMALGLQDGSGDLLLESGGSLLLEYPPGLITLGSPLHGDAASGNAVYLISINNEAWQ